MYQPTQKDRSLVLSSPRPRPSVECRHGMRYTLFAQSKHTRNTFLILDSFWPGRSKCGTFHSLVVAALLSPPMDVVVSVRSVGKTIGLGGAPPHQQKTCLFSFISRWQIPGKCCRVCPLLEREVVTGCCTRAARPLLSPSLSDSCLTMLIKLC